MQLQLVRQMVPSGEQWWVTQDMSFASCQAPIQLTLRSPRSTSRLRLVSGHAAEISAAMVCIGYRWQAATWRASIDENARSSMDRLPQANIAPKAGRSINFPALN